jgi:hypothetical protein
MAQELLCVPIIGRGSARPEGGGEGNQISQISLPSRPECTKTAPKRLVLHTFCPKNRKKRHFFNLKVLYKIYSRDFFEKYINFTIFRYLRRCGVIPAFGSPLYTQ